MVEFHEQVDKAKAENQKNMSSATPNIIVDINTFKKLTELQKEYNTIIMDKARNGLTPEEFNNLDPQVQQQKINAAFAFAPPSPEMVFMTELLKEKKTGKFEKGKTIEIIPGPTIGPAPESY